MTAFDEFLDVLRQGRAWSGMNNNDEARALMDRVYGERYHSADWQHGKYQLRANLKADQSVGAYAAWITAENPTSGPFQGTSFTWFPGEGGSVAILGIGLDGFGQDTHILGRDRDTVVAGSKRLSRPPSPDDYGQGEAAIFSTRPPPVPEDGL